MLIKSTDTTDKKSVISKINQCHQCSQRERVNLAARIFSYENLLKCYYNCRKRKRYTINAAKFEIHFEDELLKLQKELKSHTYHPGRSICFVVIKPKPREIFAADFRDRIVHHILVNYLEKIWEPKFIDQSYSCRKEKGAHRAIKDLKRYIRKVSRDNRQPTYYLQADIRSFFVSLKKDVLFELIKNHVKNPEILWLTQTIIFHNPTSDYYRKCQMSLFDLIPDHKSLFKVPSGQGLPIGNYSSQFFANLYLNKLDQFIKRELKCKYYLRYVDDLVILEGSREKLKYLRDKINLFLKENLDLELNLNKIKLQSTNKGIEFLGYFIKPDYILVRQRVIKRLKNKLYEINKKMEGIKDLNKILAMINSYYGHFRHASSFNLRKDIYENHLDELCRNFSLKNNYLSLNIKQ